MIKPEFGKPIDKDTYDKVIFLFEKLLKALHPFMPFITEELWQEISPREKGASITVASWPKASGIHFDYCRSLEIKEFGESFDGSREGLIDKILDGISFVRKIRQQSGLKHSELSEVYVEGGGAEKLKSPFGRVSSRNLQTPDFTSSTFQTYPT